MLSAAPASCLAHPAARPPQPSRPGRWPLDDARLQGRLWRGNSFGATTEPVLSSGFDGLDAELPGGGWPLRGVTELLTPQPGVLEWRLLAPALHRWWASQALPATGPGRRPRQAAAPLRSLLLVNPPHTPHLPGLQALGLPPSALIWVAARTPTDALWATEQAIK